MPEWGMLPMPVKLLKQGVREMMRISDARMSGTSYGACILHVSPEASIGGPLALVETGDMIPVDVAARRLDLDVQPDEFGPAPRRLETTSPRYERGYGWICIQAYPSGQRRLRLSFSGNGLRSAFRGTGNLLSERRGRRHRGNGEAERIKSFPQSRFP